MKVSLVKEAQFELDETIDYYNNQLTGLGQDFLNEFLSTIERICNYPDAWHPLTKNTKRCQTRRFPYGIIYAVEEGEILILSISHLHREPNHWKDRLDRY